MTATLALRCPKCAASIPLALDESDKIGFRTSGRCAICRTKLVLRCERTLPTSARFYWEREGRTA